MEQSLKVQQQLLLDLEVENSTRADGGGDFPTNWRPARGEGPNRLLGEVLRWETPTKAFDRDDGEPVRVLVVRDFDDRLWNVWGFHLLLSKALKRKDPKPGDFIALEYRGRHEGKN